MFRTIDVAADVTVDDRMVEASADGFATVPVSVKLDNLGLKQQWIQASVDATPVAGKVFQVRFRFDGKVANTVPTRVGWFVDDVVVQ